MPDNERIKKLEAEVEKLTSQINKAKSYIVIGGPIIIGLLTAFFGITYNKIGSQIEEAVSTHINGTVFEKATDRLEKASLNTKKKIEESFINTEKRIGTLREETQKKYESITQNLPNIHETMTKLNRYDELASAKVSKIEESLKKAEQLAPSINKFSVYGEAKDGEVISVPSGNVNEWSIMISPKYIGQWGGVSSPNTPLLSADYSVKVASPTTWEITALTRYKFGTSVKVYSGHINYLLVPSILTNKVNANN